MKSPLSTPSARRALPSCLAALVFAWSLATSAIAAGPYLAPGRPDALALLAPPPAPGSAEQAADLASVWMIFKTRTTNDEAAAKAEVDFTVFSFAPEIGTNFTPGQPHELRKRPKKDNK